jgi:hypothetical protein
MYSIQKRQCDRRELRRLFCEEKIYVEYLQSETVIFVCRDPLLGDD